MTAQNQYLSALASCRHIAKDEYTVVEQHFAQCDRIIDDLRKELKTVVKQSSQALSHTKALEDGLTNIQHDLERDYAALLAKRSANLTKQKRSLEHFNVMLFGRTMAGKSTIREAITGGDGQTIGKGAQRTTRDVKEYEWNNLRIIDTPGFGAYNGKEDTEIAREILEQSDVVLFLLNSDSIQESTFIELEHVYKLNKPLIFVLNMKKDLENPGNRRRALKSPEKYVFKEEDIQQHGERLKKLAARAGINPATVRVIPIHAQAAFLATREEQEEGKLLHEFSRIDELLNALQKEVESNGPIRRIQTFLDSSLHHIDAQSLLILDQKERLECLLPQYESGLTRIATWKDKTLRDAPRMLAKEVDAAFKPLIDSVADFVDDHIEDSNVSKAWDQHYKSFNISKRIEQAAGYFSVQIVDELEDFNREVKEGLDISLSFDVKHNGSSFNETDFKRINGWGFAISGVVSAIAFFNAWNPIGWVAVGIGVLFTVFGIFSDSKAKKLKEAKAKQRQALLDDIEKIKRKVKGSLNDWFDENLCRKLMMPAINNLSLLCASMSLFISQLNASESKLYNLKHEINNRLLNRLAYIVTGKHFNFPRFKKIVRVPGYACYFLISDYFRNGSLLRELSKSMRETLVSVYDMELEGKILHLFKGLYERIEVAEGNKVMIYARKENISKIIGKEHRRIKMAAALCSCEITPVPV